MRRFVAGFLVGFAASCAVASASSTINHNGMFWNRLGPAAKDGYVNGYADAMEISVSKLGSLTTASDLFHWRGSRKIIREVEMQLSLSEIQSEDVVNRLDTLYRNREYGELDVCSALQLVALQPKTHGAAASSGK